MEEFVVPSIWKNYTVECRICQTYVLYYLLLGNNNYTEDVEGQTYTISELVVYRGQLKREQEIEARQINKAQEERTQKNSVRRKQRNNGNNLRYQ